MTKRSGAPCICPSKHHGRCREAAASRLSARVNVAPNGCWIYQGPCTDSGYGWFWHDGSSGAAHRAAYAIFVGPIPAGQQIDHTCHNTDSTCKGGETCRHRRCVNPAHLEAVSPRTNVLRSENSPSGINVRKTHCDRGHPLSGSNLYVCPRGKRECRACRHAATASYKARQEMKVS